MYPIFNGILDISLCSKNTSETYPYTSKYWGLIRCKRIDYFMSRNDSLISIIVPVYNVEQYLSRCVDSLVNQTYHNIEIILVDDGSPDRSGEICDEYAKKDKRVKVIHQSNGGLSDARNTALDIAKGDYLMFVDSDDWIEKNV